MLPESTKLISVDDHIIEHPRVWLDRLPSKFLEEAPRVIELDDGTEAWKYGNELVPQIVETVKLLDETAIHGEKKPVRFDEMRPGCYDPKARLADMDRDGVWMQLNFPNFPRFAGHRFLMNPNHDLGLACVTAYNDFVIDEWCAAAPGRYIPLNIVPWWDIDKAVAEVYRVAAKGSKAIGFSENPTVLGRPSIHTDTYDRLWAAIQDVDLAVCLHIGSSSKFVTSSPDAGPGVNFTCVGLNSELACADWLFCGALERFPGLRVALSEGGAGWVPYILERADKAFAVKPEELAIHRLPSELFRSNVFACIVTDKFAVDSVQAIGEDNLMWEGDFPHHDGMWPHSRAALEEAMADVPDEIAHKVASGTAARVFRLAI